MICKRLKIGRLDVVILSPDDKSINSYLDKEYNLIVNAPYKTKPDIIIRIKTCNIDEKPGNYQRLNAFNRYIDIEHLSAQKKCIYIKHRFTDKLFSIISPFHETRFEASLTDFFHSVFLGILQENLVMNHQSLFHASSIIFENSEKATVFFGKAQSGKSSIIGSLANNRIGSIISEDFCVVDENGIIYALPHISRVDLNEYDEVHKQISTLDNLNRFVLKIAGKEAKRRLAFKELYTHADIRMEADIDRIVLLIREGKDIHMEHCKEEEFVDYCMSVLNNEFINFSGFKEMLDNPNYKSALSWDDMLLRTKKVIKKIYSTVPCQKLYVPIYDTPDKAADMVKNFFCERQGGFNE